MRGLVRDNIRGSLPGADATVPNSVLRVLSDSQAALCHLTLQYIDWLALQLLPDTAETEWLDRHGDIWLVNADGSTGRKMATLSHGTVLVTGTVEGSIVAAGARLNASNGVQYETLTFIVVGVGAPVPVDITALDPGSIGNLDPGEPLAFVEPVPGVDNIAIVDLLEGGTEEETDDQLRSRVLLRIQQPPMGGDAKDYVQWALSVPGVTRAWCYPNEMGIGTVTVRFMMDVLRAEDNGFPKDTDIYNVEQYLNTVRPVAIKDFFVAAPIPFPIDHYIYALDSDTAATRNEIEASLKASFVEYTSPGQTWYRAWSEDAIFHSVGVSSFDLALTDDQRHIATPSPGFMPTLGSLFYLP